MELIFSGNQDDIGYIKRLLSIFSEPPTHIENRSVVLDLDQTHPVKVSIEGDDYGYILAIEPKGVGYIVKTTSGRDISS